MKTKDPIALMAGELAHKRVTIFRKWVEDHGMNYLKLLCLNWQAATGKKCTNRKHLKGEYGRELECEAQLVDSLTMALRLGQLNDREFSGFMQELTNYEKNHV